MVDLYYIHYENKKGIVVKDGYVENPEKGKSTDKIPEPGAGVPGDFKKKRDIQKPAGKAFVTVGAFCDQSGGGPDKGGIDLRRRYRADICRPAPYPLKC